MSLQKLSSLADVFAILLERKEKGVDYPRIFMKKGSAFLRENLLSTEEGIKSMRFHTSPTDLYEVFLDEDDVIYLEAEGKSGKFPLFSLCFSDVCKSEFYLKEKPVEEFFIRCEAPGLPALVGIKILQDDSSVNNFEFTDGLSYSITLSDRKARELLCFLTKNLK